MMTIRWYEQLYLSSSSFFEEKTDMILPTTWLLTSFIFSSFLVFLKQGSKVVSYWERRMRWCILFIRNSEHGEKNNFASSYIKCHLIISQHNSLWSRQAWLLEMNDRRVLVADKCLVQLHDVNIYIPLF